LNKRSIKLLIQHNSSKFINAKLQRVFAKRDVD